MQRHRNDTMQRQAQLCQDYHESNTLDSFWSQLTPTSQLDFTMKWTLFIRTITGKINTLEVDSTDSIEDIKIKLKDEQEIPFPIKTIKLLKDLKILQDDKKLSDYDLGDGATLLALFTNFTSFDVDDNAERGKAICQGNNYVN